MTKRILSIDIGISKTRVCEIDYGKKVPCVYKCITFDTPENAMEDGYIRDKQALAAVLQRNLVEAGMRRTEVVFTVSSTKIASREVVIPLVKDNRIQAVVDAGAQEYFPVDVSEYIVSYSIIERISTKEDRKLKLLLLAAPNNLIKNYYSFAQMMNFSVLAMDYVGNSVFQVLKQQVGQHISLTIQINEQNTLVNIIDHEILALQRTIPYGTGTVLEAVLENRIAGKENEREAMALLCTQELINPQLSMDHGEAAATLSAESESYERIFREIREKEEITESLRQLINNVIRVLDYYNSKFPEKRVEDIYITGPGARLKGIGQLFRNETGYETKTMDRLVPVTFHKNTNWEGFDQTDYVCAIGAVIRPIGFVSKDIIERAAKKSNQFSILIILALSVFTSLVLVLLSSLNLYAAIQEKRKLEAEVKGLLPVEEVFAQHSRLQAEYQEVTDMYALTVSRNEQLNELISGLEARLPSTAVVSSLNITDSGISMNIVTNNKLTAAKLYQQLTEMEAFYTVSIASIAESEDENGIKMVSFAVNCTYGPDTAPSQSEENTQEAE
ncbi:MAG TPA: pilus assembly protein PilM [Clostridiales bacterium]|nr:pilus assembly protein PilM [Clostridiales bacterium]